MNNKEKRIEIIKDKFVDKKYIIKIKNGIENDGIENKIFITFLKQLSQLGLGIFTGFTADKTYNSAFFYVNHNCCGFKEFLNYNITINGYGSGYNFDNEYISGNNNLCNISYDHAVFMANSLSQQIYLLEKMGYGFYCFSLDNVYVIDNHIFLYLGIEHLIRILEVDVKVKVNDYKNKSREKVIRFISPYPEKTFIINETYDYKTNLFISPEIKFIKNIPCSILYSSTYYHLASFIIYSMFNKNICFNNNDKVFDIELLSSIKNTKLYWFLIRCIDKQPSKRILLWI
jgi:hypothetical protein